MDESAATHRSYCPINIALEIFGDRWSLLIIRDLMFNGVRGFSDFQNAEEGIATNILSSRLQTLQGDGLIEQLPDPTDGRRRIYVLTEKGFALAPTIVEIVLWSAEYHQTAAPPEQIAAMTADRTAFIEGMRQLWLAARQ
jgi:DNA-binding HxlR family transcriptional regulator